MTARPWGAPAQSADDDRAPFPIQESPTVSSAVLPSFLPAFESMGLPRKVLAALVLEDIETPAPSSRSSSPTRSAGRNVLGRARTGSGKTLAFGLPVLARLAGGTSRPKAPRALILLPTRELATQVRTAAGAARAEDGPDA